MAKERSRRFREKKRLNVLKSVHHVVHSLYFCRVILSTHRLLNLWMERGRGKWNEQVTRTDAERLTKISRDNIPAVRRFLGRHE